MAGKAMQPMNCPACGTALRPGMPFCHACGARIAGAATAPGADRTPRAPDGGTHERLVSMTLRLLARSSGLSWLVKGMGVAEFVVLRWWVVLGGAAVAAVMGFYLSRLGHIETTPVINLVMPFISCINPTLGLLSAIAFGVADFIEKLFTNNVYYESHGGGLGDYIGARIGYIIAYSAVAAWTVLPGLLSRALGGRVRRWAEERAAARSIGAGAVPTGTKRFLELAAGSVGAAIGGGLANVLNIGLQAPAFMLRPTPDFSCFNAAINHLLDPSLSTGVPATATGAAPTGPVAVSGSVSPDAGAPASRFPTRRQPRSGRRPPPRLGPGRLV